MKRIFLFFTFALLLMPQFAAAKTFRVVTSANFPPYEFIQKGEIVGIDIDIVREMLRRNGHDMTVTDMKFDSVIASLQTGKGDIGASGITVTEDRKREVDFTIPYVTAEQVVIVKKYSPLTSPDALKGKRIGVQHGTTGDTYVTENIQEPERFDDGAVAVAALLRNKLDAVVLDGDPARVHVKKNPSLQILAVPLTFEEYAFAIPKGNEDLLDQFNRTLLAMHRDGTIDEIVRKYQQQTDVIIQDMPDSSDDGSLCSELYHNFVKDNRWRYLLDGFWVTIIVAVCSVLAGVAIGFLVAIIRSTSDQTGKYKILDFLCRIYLTVIRGTPVVLQLMIIYFVIFGSMNVNKIIVAVIAFGVNSGAYVAEIIRSGIMSIDRGQMEAGRSLGLSYAQTMRMVILPQALKNVLPALGNEFIVLLKETSVCGFIALQDLTKGGDIIRSQTYNAFLPLIVVALIYLLLVVIFSKCLAILEKRLKRNE